MEVKVTLFTRRWLGIVAWFLVIALLFLVPCVFAARSLHELELGFVVTEESAGDPAVPSIPPEYEADDESETAFERKDPQVVIPSLAQLALRDTGQEETSSRMTTETLSMPVYKYWGCYEYRTGDLVNLGGNTTFTTNGSSYNPSDCIDYCYNNYGTEIAMVRGRFCECQTWEKFTKSRVNDSYCSLPCQADTSESCGGNLVHSVYCMIHDHGECSSQNMDSVSPLSTIPVTSDVEVAEIIPRYICAACANPNVELCVGAGFSQSSEYFPQNSPEACVEHCRSNVTRDNTSIPQFSYAITGWRYYDGVSVPICYCGDDSFFKSLEPEQCESSCPASPRFLCGDSNRLHFTIYCARSGPFCDLADGDLVSESSTLPTAPMTQTTTTSTTSNSTNATEATETTTVTSSVTDSSTSTSTPSTTSSSTTTLRTTTTTTTVTTTTTKSSACSITCRETDLYGNLWTGCGGKISYRDCGAGRSGQASWFCEQDGYFASDGPNFRECKTAWKDEMVEQVEEALSNNKTFSEDETAELLSQMQNLCTVSTANKVPYHGHEIPAISKLVFKIVKNTNATFQNRETLVSRAVIVSRTLLSNSDQWREIVNISERAEAASQTLDAIEESTFTLSSSDTPEMYSVSFVPSNTSSDSFVVGFGTGSNKTTQKKPLRFPLATQPSTSYITLPAGWEDLSSTPSYVGMSISPTYVKSQLSPALISSINGDSRIINSNMLSLTLAENPETEKAKSVNLKGTKVRITFYHHVEAWGSAKKTIYRKLHPGETPKVSQGGALCAYWWKEKSRWDTSGCKIVESTRTYSVCECNHLTSFAILMDPHQYVSKEKTLEVLTIILCSFSAMSLIVCVIIFSTVHSIQNQRTTITKHLCICLAVGIVLLLLFVDRNYFHIPESMCIAVGIVTHYVYLAAFMWMLIEGMHLYKLVVHVFDSEQRHTTIYRIIAYGMPIIIVGATCAAGALLGDQPYRGDVFCWLEGPYMWTFIGPVALVVMINIIILFVTLKVAYQMQVNTTALQNRRRSYRTWIRGSFSITVLLGITWLPGFFMTSPSESVAKVSAYIFVILNASQGIFLFWYHCAFNEKVRMAAQRNLPSWLSLSQNSTPSRECTQSRSGKGRGPNTTSFKSSSRKYSLPQCPTDQEKRIDRRKRRGESCDENSNYDSGVSGDYGSDAYEGNVRRDDSENRRKKVRTIY